MSNLDEFYKPDFFEPYNVFRGFIKSLYCTLRYTKYFDNEEMYQHALNLCRDACKKVDDIKLYEYLNQKSYVKDITTDKFPPIDKDFKPSIELVYKSITEIQKYEKVLTYLSNNVFLDK